MKMANGLVQVAVVGGEEQHVLLQAGLPGLRHQRAGAGAAVVLLQQHVWRVSGVQRAGQQVRFRSREGVMDWSKPLLDGGSGAGLGLAEPHPHAATGGRGLRLQFDNAVRATAAQDPEPDPLRAGEEREEARRLPRRFRLSAALHGRQQLRGLSRLAARPHVGDRSVPRATASACVRKAWR